MKDLGKILRINLLILLAYSLTILAINYSATSSGDPYAGIGFAIFMMGAIGLHTLINLILGIVKFVQKDKELGQSYLVSMLVVGVVGFSSCLGGSALF